MAYLGSWAIDDWLTFYCNTHRADTGAATDADAVPTYRIYEDETGAAIANGNMALLDAANTAGFYSERVQLLAATGFEQGRQYVIYISATVNAIEGTIQHTFQVGAEVAGASIAAAVWSYATRTLTSFGTLVADIVSALLDVPAVRTARQQIHLELYRGDTWEQNIWRLGDISTRTKLWITARFQRDDADSTSAFQIEETAGLIYINGTAGTPANGSITVVDAAAGSITVRLEAVETAKLDALNNLYYDVQWTDGTDVLTPRRGRLLVISDVTRATS